MKILLLTDKMDVGGAETHVFTLARALVRLGHRVTVASSGGALAQRLKKCGIPHLTLPLSSKAPLDIAHSYLALRSLLSKGGFDAVHSHARIPSLLASSVARKKGIPLICTVHAKFSLSFWRRALSRWGNKTISVSQDLAQYLAEGYSVPPENITVIPNGIDTEEFSPLPAPSSPLRIAFLSRLDEDCSLGAELLCSIAPRLADKFGRLEIAIGGGGDRLEYIEKTAQRINSQLPFDCIKVLGEIRNVPEFLHSAHIFVGVSRAAMEAALCSLPVILCGNEGFFGRLTADNFALAAADNLCCRCCEAADRDKLFAELSAIISSPPADIERVRELTKRRFDAENTARATAKLYESVELPQKKAELLLCGYYGFGNMGDDILLRRAILRAQNQFPELSVGALTLSPRKDTRRFGVRCFSRRLPLALFACKHLVFGGGTLLQENTSLRSLCYYSALILLAKRLGVRTYLWGNGVDTPRSPFGRYLMHSALDACDYIGLRDGHSLSVARSLTANPNIFIEDDLAAGAPPCSSERADYLLRGAFGKAIPQFVIAAPKKANGLSSLKTALKKAKKKGYRLLFVAMYPKADIKITRSLCRELGGHMIENICYADLVGIAKRSDGVYSMRLHALIAARSAAVPCYPFGDDSKLKGFFIH